MNVGRALHMLRLRWGSEHSHGEKPMSGNGRGHTFVEALVLRHQNGHGEALQM